MTENNEIKMDTRILAGDRYEWFYRETGLPLQYMYENIQLRPEKIDERVFDSLQKIYDRCIYFFSNHGSIFITSQNVGNGKTSWAIKIMKRYIQEYACFYNLDCLFVNVPEFFELRKRSFNNASEQHQLNELTNRIKEAKLVIFDDLAVGKLTDAEENFFYTIIDYRWRNNKSSIYTTNVYPNELKTMIGERTVDRIVNDQKTIRIWLQGSSRRGVVSKPTQTFIPSANPDFIPHTTKRTTSDEVF